MYEINNRKSTFFKRIIQTGIFVFLIVMLSSLTSFIPHKGNGQECTIKFIYRVDDTTGGNNNGKIYLQRIEGDGPFTVRLFDMENTAGGYIKTIKNKNFPAGRMILVFKGLAPSTYLIKVENGSCSRSVTGIEGILIK